MPSSPQSPLLSLKAQCYAICLAALAFLGAMALHLLRQPLSFGSAVGLTVMAYVAFRIVFELTWNRKNVPTMASGFAARRKMAKILRQVEENTRVSREGKPFDIVDLGSGRGELSCHLARNVPNARVTGVEIARWPSAQANWLKKLLRADKASFVRGDFNGHDCGGAHAVVMYLNGKIAMQLGEKLWRELKPGAVVLSHTFPLRGNWEPQETVSFRTPFLEQIHVYRKPE